MTSISKFESFFFIILLLLTLTPFSSINSLTESYNFSIRYLGVKVAEVELSDEFVENQGTITVIASSTGTGNLLFRFDNIYTVVYQNDYFPVSYMKDIKQKGFSLSKKTTFNHAEQNFSVVTKESSRTYDMEQVCRDFFSSLLYLRKNRSEAGMIYVYANNNVWRADYSLEKKETINRKSSSKYVVHFSKESKNKRERSDVLTNNIVKEDNALLIWFSDDEDSLPLKAEYQASPFSVFWVLEDFSGKND
jgi:hypothetical protein